MNTHNTAMRNMPNVPQTGSENCLPVGTRLAEFEITGVVGEGGFGSVYLAFDHSLQRTVAIKEYMPGSLAARGADKSVLVRSERHQETFEAGLKSFINEARLLAQFDHPALVKVYRFWEQNKTGYMAMRYYEGQTLKSILKNDPTLVNEAWLKFMLAPLMEALDALYQIQILHRDISPDNIMIQKNGASVLLDFGAARQIIGDMTQALTVILKPGFAPIEQYADDTSMKQGPWTDIYALSAVIYSAIVKKPPPTSVARMIRDPIEPLQSGSHIGFSQEFLAGIDKGLSVKPEDRPQSIDEFRALLGLAIPAPSLPHDPFLAFTSTVTISTHAPRTESANAVLHATSTPAVILGAAIAAPEIPLTDAAEVITLQPLDINLIDSSNESATTPIITTDNPVMVPPAPPTPPKTAPKSTQSENNAEAKPVTPIKKSSSARGSLALLLVGILIVVGYGSYQLTRPNNDATTIAATATPTSPEAASESASASAIPGNTPVVSAVPPTVDEEAVAWDALKDSTKTDDIVGYINKYPMGKFTDQARSKLAELKEKAAEVERTAAAAATSASARTLAATKPADASPVPASGTVKLTIKPWGTIVVDGVSKGVSPPLKHLTLTEGKHQIKVANPNFSDYVTEIDVNKKKPGSIDYDFSQTPKSTPQ